VTTATTRTAYAAWVAICLIWGTTYLAIRIALETIPPALIGGVRYTLAGGVLVVALRTRGERLPHRAYWAGLALLGALMIVVGNGFIIWAEQWVPSGFAALLVASTPFWMAGIEALAGGDRLTVRATVGLALGFGGILVLVWPDLPWNAHGRAGFAGGVIAAELACLGWALGSSYSRRRARDENALASAALQMVFGGLMMMALALLRGEWAHATLTARTAAAELYLIVFGSLVGYSSYIYALKHLPVPTVSL
jgi:drug/metabolite transporter (DMT)-like permease